MRKLSVLFVVVAFVSVFCSCNKERLGDFRPELKIARIYDEAQGHYLREQWLWNGNQLSRIDFYKQSGDVDYSQEYIYDGRRLQRIETDDIHSDFVYKGKILTGIETYYGDQLQDTYAFTYKKNRLDHLSITKNSKSTTGSTLLDLFVPGFDCHAAESASPKGDEYDYSSAEVDFNWVDDDIRSVKMTMRYPDKELQRVYSYVYDDGVNPKMNFFSLLADHQLMNNNPENLFCSKHNVKGMYVTVSENGQVVNSKSLFFTYEYYRKFPMKMYRSDGYDTLLLVSYLYQ